MRQLSLLLGIALLTTACTTVFKRYPFSMINPSVFLEPLKRDQYTILGDIEGRSEGGYLFRFIPVPFAVGGTKAVSGSLSEGMEAKIQAMGRGQVVAGLGKIEQQALYNALEGQPDADGIIAVRVIKGMRMEIPLLYWKEQVTIKGKAIKIKKDKSE